MYLKIFNKSKETVVGDKIYVAETFISRLRGLIGKTQLFPREGMLFPRCNCIHTFGMKFGIDVLFLTNTLPPLNLPLTKGKKIIQAQHLIINLPPGRITPVIWRAKYVLELPVGVVKDTLTTVGDYLDVSESQ